MASPESMRFNVTPHWNCQYLIHIIKMVFKNIIFGIIAWRIKSMIIECIMVINAARNIEMLAKICS